MNVLNQRTRAEALVNSRFALAHAMNDSALHQFEGMQTRYRVTRSVEAIYEKVTQGIRLKPLYKTTACGTVLCTTSTEVSSMYQRKNNHGVGVA